MDGEGGGREGDGLSSNMCPIGQVDSASYAYASMLGLLQ